MSNTETSESSVYAIIYVLRDGSWIVCNPVSSSNTGWNELHLYHDATDDSDRLVGWTVDDQKVLINVAINKSCDYSIKTADFHKFTDGKESFGFGFFKDSLVQATTFKRAVLNAIEKDKAKSPLHFDSYPRTTDYSQSVKTLPASLNKFTSANQKAAVAAYNSTITAASGFTHQDHQLKNVNEINKSNPLNKNNITTVHVKDSNSSLRRINSIPSPSHAASSTFTASPVPLVRDPSLLRIKSTQSPNRVVSDLSPQPQFDSLNSISNSDISQLTNSPPPVISLSVNSNLLEDNSDSIRRATIIDPNAPPPPPPRRNTVHQASIPLSNSSQNQSVVPPLPPLPPHSVINNGSSSVRGPSHLPLTNQSLNSRSASPNTYNSVQINSSIRSPLPQDNQTNSVLNNMFVPPSGYNTTPVVLSENNYPRRSSLKTINYESSAFPPVNPTSNLTTKTNSNETSTSPPPPPPPPRKSIVRSAVSPTISNKETVVVPPPLPKSLLKKLNTVTSIDTSIDTPLESPPNSPNRIIHNFEPKYTPQMNTVPISNLDYSKGPVGKLEVQVAKPAKNRGSVLIKDATISDVYGVVHTSHVSYNTETCAYKGLPLEWESLIHRQFGLMPNEVDNKKLPEYTGKIPKILIFLKEQLLLYNGLSTVGIFRLAPDCAFIKSEINMGRWMTHRNKAHPDANIFANLIKVFFRDLPQSLLQTVSVDDIKNCNNENDVASVLSKIKDPWSSLLFWIFDLCLLIASQSNINKMTTQNLSIVFAPNLFNTNGIVDPMEAIQFTQKVCQFLHKAMDFRQHQRN